MRSVLQRHARDVHIAVACCRRVKQASHRETVRRLSWPGIPCANPLRAALLPATSRGAADRLLEKCGARKNGETKRASATVLFSTHPRTLTWPLTAPRRAQRPYLCHIAHHQPISVCDQHIVPAPPAQPACQPALGLVDDYTHALASIVPPLRGRREDWPCLTVVVFLLLLCVSLQRGPETLPGSED